MWAILIAFSVPEIGTLIRAARICFFKVLIPTAFGITMKIINNFTSFLYCSHGSDQKQVTFFLFSLWKHFIHSV